MCLRQSGKYILLLCKPILTFVLFIGPYYFTYLTHRCKNLFEKQCLEVASKFKFEREVAGAHFHPQICTGLASVTLWGSSFNSGSWFRMQKEGWPDIYRIFKLRILLSLLLLRKQNIWCPQKIILIKSGPRERL